MPWLSKCVGVFINPHICVLEPGWSWVQGSSRAGQFALLCNWFHQEEQLPLAVPEQVTRFLVFNIQTPIPPCFWMLGSNNDPGAHWNPALGHETQLVLELCLHPASLSLLEGSQTYIVSSFSPTLSPVWTCPVALFSAHLLLTELLRWTLDLNSRFIWACCCTLLPALSSAHHGQILQDFYRWFLPVLGPPLASASVFPIVEHIHLCCSLKNLFLSRHLISESLVLSRCQHK